MPLSAFRPEVQRYLAEDGDLLLGDSSELPLLPLPLLPLPADDVLTPESAATHSTGGGGGCFQCPRRCRLTCLGRAPSMRVRLCPHLLDNLPGCQ